MFRKQIEHNHNIRYRKYIESNIDKEYNLEHLSSNPHISLDIIFNNINKNWDWLLISYRKDITPKIVFENINLPWCWEILSLRKNFNFDIILNNLERVQFCAILELHHFDQST